MLVAYFDDSGTHKAAPVCLLAGFIANSVLIDRLERDWKAELGTRENISWFHASDCEEGEGEFENMPRPLRDSLAFGLSNVVCRQSNNLQFICSALKRQDWDQHAPAFLKERCGDPYYFVVEHCFQQVSSWSREIGGREPVALVIARHPQHDKETEAIHERYFSHASYGLPGIGSLTFGDPRLIVPLQTADQFAYEMYRWAGVYTGPDTPMRPVLENLHKNGVSMFAAIHDKDSLAEIGPRPTPPPR